MSFEKRFRICPTKYQINTLLSAKLKLTHFRSRDTLLINIVKSFHNTIAKSNVIETYDVLY